MPYSPAFGSMISIYPHAKGLNPMDCASITFEWDRECIKVVGT